MGVHPFFHSITTLMDAKQKVLDHIKQVTAEAEELQRAIDVLQKAANKDENN